MRQKLYTSPTKSQQKKSQFSEAQCQIIAKAYEDVNSTPERQRPIFFHLMRYCADNGPTDHKMTYMKRGLVFKNKCSSRSADRGIKRFKELGYMDRIKDEYGKWYWRILPPWLPKVDFHWNELPNRVKEILRNRKKERQRLIGIYEKTAKNTEEFSREEKNVSPGESGEKVGEQIKIEEDIYIQRKEDQNVHSATAYPENRGASLHRYQNNFKDPIKSVHVDTYRRFLITSYFPDYPEDELHMVSSERFSDADIEFARHRMKWMKNKNIPVINTAAFVQSKAKENKEKKKMKQKQKDDISIDLRLHAQSFVGWQQHHYPEKHWIWDVGLDTVDYSDQYAPSKRTIYNDIKEYMDNYKEYKKYNFEIRKKIFCDLGKHMVELFKDRDINIFDSSLPFDVYHPDYYKNNYVETSNPFREI